MYIYIYIYVCVISIYLSIYIYKLLVFCLSLSLEWKLHEDFFVRHACLTPWNSTWHIVGLQIFED